MIYGNSNFDRMFDSIFNQSPLMSVKTYSNLKEETDYEINYTKDGAYLHLDVPGFNKSNLKVEMENGYVFIDGKREYKLNGEEVVKNISKKFQIGDGYKSESVEATIEDGVLTVFVPNYKKQEKKRISLL
jgi:HSP20 family molecular chaperone IbpA